MVAAVEADWSVLGVGIASFLLVLLALTLRSKNGGSAEEAAAPIRVEASLFRRPGEPGDFEYEIKRRPDLSARTLYIFNDNAEQHRSSVRGGGNAAVRPYNVYNLSLSGTVRSAGISTGASRSAGGFPALSPSVKSTIDAEIREVKELLSSGDYECLKYSVDPSNAKLIGTGT